MAVTKYVVKAGDTLNEIAAQFGVDADDLALRNGIRDADFISVGQTIIISDDADETVHIVRAGDSMSAIAAAHGVTVDAIMAANPKIRNASLIFPGQRIVIPAGNPPPAAAGPGNGSEDLHLSAQDVIDIKKTLQSEWVQAAGDDQAKGIVDTILNRLASEHWGPSVATVVNARNQFSDINGPVSRRDGRHSVDAYPWAKVSDRVRNFVDAYLAARAGGTPSKVGSHLNYANPHFSDSKNLPWIMALDGPVLGKGNAIHRHGTVPEYDRFRPGPYRVVLPGGAVAAAVAPTGSIDGNQIAEANDVGVKSSDVKIGALHPAMEAVIVAVAKAAHDLGLPKPVITSGNDSKHSRNSLHYANRALDFRGRDLTIAQGDALDRAVTKLLGPKYDVIFETFLDKNNNHLHVEYDPR